MPLSSAGQPASAITLSLAETQLIIAKATLHGVPWTGPESGPPAQPGKSIAFISEDLRNGGILGVAQGVREAVRTMGWTLKIFDAGGTSAGRLTAFERAMASKPDGLILCGADAQNSNPELARIASRGIPIVAWHAGSTPGPIAGTPVAMNVTTDPVEVARVTALGAVAQSNGHAGVVILTDSRFEIAVTKSNVMADIIRACKGCTLLEVRDVAISESAEKMPAITKALLARYGKRWTDALAINDIYFDYAAPALTKAGVPSSGLSLLSAGDGSASAFLRIQAKTYQTGTVAEPLNQQGWQLVDELNRLFAGQPVSGFVAPVHLVNADNIAFDGGERFQYDPKNGYRDIYRRIWKR
ncbi:substrate-binding domain-containing protein [Caballeronia udeis]